MLPHLPRLRGFALEELAYDPISKALTPESFRVALKAFREEFALEMSRTADPSLSRVLQLEYYKKDGSTLWAEVQARFLRDENGSLIGLTGISRDISERRALEEVMRKSEERYRLIAANISDVVWTADLGLNLTYIRPSVERVSGFTPEELLAKKAIEMMTPESFARVLEIFFIEMESEQHLAAPDFLKTLELEYFKKDSSTYWNEVRVTFMHGADGNPIGLIGVGRDIPKCKKMEAAMPASEERYRIISDVISDYTFTAKKNELGVFVSDWVAGEFEGITGYTLPEYITQGGWDGILHPDSLMQDKLDRALLSQNKKVNGSEIQIIRKGGETRWLRNFAYPIWNESANERVGIYGAAQDITVEKNALKEVQLLNASLEQRVQERTQQLEGALSEMQAFSYISHDLRAPLRSVSGFATILINEHGGGLPQDALNKLKNIRESGQRMGRLIDGLLDYLRSDDGQFTRQIVDPPKIVRLVLDWFASQIADRQVEFVIGELPTCIANVRMLERVYEELLGNAIQFTRLREKARIEIGSYPENNRIVYFVKDNGAGFNMKYYDKLFGVFQRLHHENEFEGSGANLAIVNRILQRLGGRIWAEAEVDKGATFYFMV